jgi:hypothetical protein
MSWSLTAYGHTLTKADESALVDAITELLRSERFGTGYATMGTQHHGQVRIKAGSDGGDVGALHAPVGGAAE